MPLFTVIINNYNYGLYLRSCIESILRQSCSDFEIFLVDDGSTDNSLDIARSFDDVRLIQTNRLNQARACLTAFRQSTGEYIYFLDADDEAKPDLLAECARAAASEPTKIQFQMEVVDEHGEVIEPAFPSYPPDYDRRLMIEEIRQKGTYLTPQTSGNVFSRRIIERIDDIDYEGSIDGVSLLLPPFFGEVATISKPLARYRLHGRNRSRRTAAERFRNERNRFMGRLRHLDRILAESGMSLDLEHSPEDMLFVIDSLMMENLSEGRRPDPGLMSNFLRTAFGQAGSTRTLKLTAWALLMMTGPKRLRDAMFELRSNPWSPLRRRLSGGRASPSSPARGPASPVRAGGRPGRENRR